MEPNQQPTGDNTNSDPANITEERAARRFHQMRNIERQLAKIDKRITDVKDKLTTLKEQRAAQIELLLSAARDEGTLPLFEDLD